MLIYFELAASELVHTSVRTVYTDTAFHCTFKRAEAAILLPDSRFRFERQTSYRSARLLSHERRSFQRNEKNIFSRGVAKKVVHCWNIPAAINFVASIRPRKSHRLQPTAPEVYIPARTAAIYRLEFFKARKKEENSRKTEKICHWKVWIYYAVNKPARMEGLRAREEGARGWNRWRAVVNLGVIGANRKYEKDNVRCLLTRRPHT